MIALTLNLSHTDLNGVVSSMSSKVDGSVYQYTFSRSETKYSPEVNNVVHGIPTTLQSVFRQNGFAVFTNSQFDTELVRTREAQREEMRAILIDAHLSNNHGIVYDEGDLNAVLRLLGMAEYTGKWSVEVSLNGEFLGEFIVTAQSAAHAEEIISEALSPVNTYVTLKFVAEGDNVERKTASLDFDLDKFLEDADWSFSTVEYTG